MKNIKLSIIIPMYNTSEWTPNLLNHLLSQKRYRKETEIILVDDGSSENIDWVKDYDVIFIQNQHKGVSAARNSGLDISKGETIAFIDSDDDVREDYIETIIDGIGDADYLTFRYKAINGHTIKFPGMFHVWAVWGYAFKKSLIGDKRFREDMMYAEDIEWLRRVVDCNTSNARSMKKIYQYNFMVNPNSINSRLFGGKQIV